MPFVPTASSQDSSTATPITFVEPIITEETLPNGVGDWDLRVSCFYERGRTEAPENCSRAQFFFGIAPRWGVELETALPNVSGDRAEEPRAELGGTLKYLLRAPGRGPALVLAVATEAGLQRPHSSEEGRFRLQPTIAFLQTFRRTILQGNAGLSVRPGGTQTDQHAVYNLSFAVPLGRGRWHALAELAGNSGEESSQVAFSPGLKYGFGSGHFVAVGLPVGLTSASPDIGVMVQVQFSLPIGGEKGTR